MRIQRKLKEFGPSYDSEGRLTPGITPELLFNIFYRNIKEFMKGVRMRLIQEMKSLGII
jgi:hypothetical protein